MKNNYLSTLNWVVFNMVDRSTQDDHRSKINVSGAFASPVTAEEFINQLPNPSVKRYCLRVGDLERFEEFYNFIQDINEEYGDYAIFHIQDGGFSVDEENCFRSLLDIWTDTKIK